MKFNQSGKSKNCVQLPVEILDPDPDQPREHSGFDNESLEVLANTMVLSGQGHPILVRVGNFLYPTRNRKDQEEKVKAIITATRHEVSGSDIIRFGNCLEKFGKVMSNQPCHICGSRDRTACMRVRVAIKSKNKES